MNSEKVKRIKKYFEERAETRSCLLYKDKENDELDVIYCADILTLINELESENERSKDSNKNILFVNEHVIKQNDDLTKENERLKNRIAELEKDKEKWQRKAINYYEKAKSYGIECIIDTDIDEVLKECLGK